MAQSAPDLDLNETSNTALVDNFCDITSSSREEALFFLESHQWDLDSALSTFFDNNTFTPAVAEDDSSLPVNPTLPPHPSRGAANSLSDSPTGSQSPNYSPSPSPSRSRSPSPTPTRAPYTLRSGGKKKAGTSRTRGGIQTLADLNRAPDHGSGSDDDEDYEPPEYYTGGEKSGMLVQDPSKRYDGDSIFSDARNLAVERPAADNLQPSSSFTGTARLLTGEAVPSAPQPPPAFVTHTVTLWRNGFTLNDGPLRRFDDPANASFLELDLSVELCPTSVGDKVTDAVLLPWRNSISIKKTECPRELDPADRRTKVNLDLVRREENYSEPAMPKVPSKPFQGAGRTLGSSNDVNPAASAPAVPATALTSAPLPLSGLVTDPSLPTTSIQLRLADGTRMVSRFNLHHAVGDIRAFIDASRPGGSRNYQLQTMGFPPKQLTDLDQTIEQAGIANSVVIQKF